jgi:predicted metal-binding membrane protein
MQYDAMMANMGMPVDRAWTGGDLFFTFLMWAVMMVGMMSGAATPVVLLFAAAQSRRGQRGVSTLLAFGLGYIALWVGFSAFATAAQWSLHQLKLLSPALAASSPTFGGAILVGAGIYQLTPLKGTCLRHCQSPLGFLLTNWRDGLLGALQMGMRHGAYCLGCCWALMGVLFVVGVMNLVWVAALTGFVLLEKTGPAGVAVARVAGVGMVAFGLVLIARAV